MLARRDDAPFRAVVGLTAAYLEPSNRLTIDAQLVRAGHAGRGRPDEVIPGLSLRFALAAIYQALCDGKTDAELNALDERLGLYSEDDEDEEETSDPRLAADVPTSVRDPAAAAMLAALGDSLVTSD